MRRHVASLSLSLSTLFLVLGCADGAPTEGARAPMHRLALDAEAARLAMAATLEALNLAMPVPADTTTAMVSVTAGYLENPAMVSAATGCAYDHAVERFRCVAVADGDRRTERQYVVFIGGEAVNTVLGVVDSVHSWTRVTGEEERVVLGVPTRALVTGTDSGTLMVRRDRTFRSAMLSMTEQRDGARHRSVTARFATGTRELIVRERVQMRDLSRGVPEHRYRYPLSGTIVVTLEGAATWQPTDGTAPVAEPVAVVARLEFNGSSTALLRVGTQRCSVELRTRAVAGCWR